MKRSPASPSRPPAELQAPTPKELQARGEFSLPRIFAASVMFLSGTALLFLAIIGPFAWILRDGLGPNSIKSDGWASVTRTFWTFYWGPASLVAVLSFGLAFAAFRKLAGTAS